MNSIRKATACALYLAIAGAAQAQSQPPMPAAPAASVQPASDSRTMEALFDAWDGNHDKVLSFDEFKAGWKQAQAATALRNLRAIFAAKDTDKSGSLDASEYANLELIKRAGKSAPPMSAFDSDKNRALDFKEYAGMVDAMRKHP